MIKKSAAQRLMQQASNLAFASLSEYNRMHVEVTSVNRSADCCVAVARIEENDPSVHPGTLVAIFGDSYLPGHPYQLEFMCGYFDCTIDEIYRVQRNGGLLDDASESNVYLYGVKQQKLAPLLAQPQDEEE